MNSEDLVPKARLALQVRYLAVPVPSAQKLTDGSVVPAVTSFEDYVTTTVGEDHGRDVADHRRPPTFNNFCVARVMIAYALTYPLLCARDLDLLYL